MIKYDKATLKEMFDGKNISPILPYKSIDKDTNALESIASGNGHISLSGVQPKYSMVIDDGELRFTEKDERGTYILKPAPTALFLMNKEYCPINEHLTMQLARHVYKIETASCSLCEFGDGQIAYLVRRFDIREDGSKFAQEDFSQLAGLSKDNGGENFKYDILSYEDCAGLIKNYVKASQVEVWKFFRLIVFNYLILNDDAHLKNFSIIEKRTNDYVLTPAYDLLNTTLHLNTTSIFALSKGLFKEGMVIDDTHSVNRKSFEEFGHRIGLTEKLIKKELDMFSQKYDLADKIIDNSLLSERLKKEYKLNYYYRIATLTF